MNRFMEKVQETHERMKRRCQLSSLKSTNPQQSPISPRPIFKSTHRSIPPSTLSIKPSQYCPPLPLSYCAILGNRIRANHQSFLLFIGAQKNNTNIKDSRSHLLEFAWTTGWYFVLLGIESFRDITLSSSSPNHSETLMISQSPGAMRLCGHR